MANIVVKIKEKAYNISNEGYYPLILFKRTTGKNFSGNEDLEDLLTLIWCYLKAYNTDFEYLLEDFFKIVDQSIVNQFSELNSQIVNDDSEKKNQE
jgi:hypothetical protein